MELEARTYGDVLVVLSPTGRIDHESAAPFETALMPFVEACRDDAVKIVLDLSGIDYMSSVGLRVLMKAAKAARVQNGTIVVAALGSTLREIFEISRFVHIFRTYETVRDAIGAVSQPSLDAYDACRSSG